ncbi:LysM peptidoglycan-binding domain-containing protein [Thermoclostridium caenicola]|uniref:Spore germination protein n=1 Tax=Thermoclostridium caenicola TaxID=659425 RepID=A0A1M6AZS2_9FIRM|nr:LysM peptidoglycan-binding domain-containing protein [Thermoclostridium caenicola]SHI41975.1 spore germination protein [Thermoclostridium caenicola]
MRIHVVRPGESIYSIARLYDVPSERIISDNELENPEQLVPGQTLVILEGTRQYTVRPGDSIFTIARRYGVTVADLLEANPGITNPAVLQVGQEINIPPREINFGEILVNGYAFPEIDREVLRKTLPSLSFLSIFSYEVRPDGSLNTIDDEPLIQAARAARVAPFMVITNIEEGGSFSSDLANQILTNEQVQDTLIDNVLRIMREKNYYGLDIDFEYLYPRDRENYNNFLRKVSERIRPLGYSLTTALAPKISGEQMGLLYEAHDYPVHGALADHVILMTYEWGYTYSPPRAVAPLNEVRRVLDYAVSVIPRRKILMGIPNYGYNWTLPFREGSAATTISNTGAVDLARRVGAFIQFDELAQAPYFRYYDESARQHEVWFSDARSIYASLALVNEYRLGGISLWTIGRYSPQYYLVLNAVYNIRKVL